MPSNETVVANCTAWLAEPNGSVMVTEGDVWAADDPLVKRHPGAFRAADDADVKRSAPVETATSAPGEKRTVNRSTK
jgi:hypothetical protein